MTSAAFTVYNFKDMLSTVKSLVSVRTTNITKQDNTTKKNDMHQQQTAQYNIKTCIKLVHANYNIDFSQAGREHECLRLSLKNCFGLNKQTDKQTNRQTNKQTEKFKDLSPTQLTVSNSGQSSVDSVSLFLSDLEPSSHSAWQCHKVRNGVGTVHVS